MFRADSNLIMSFLLASTSPERSLILTLLSLAWLMRLLSRVAWGWMDDSRVLIFVYEGEREVKLCVYKFIKYIPDQFPLHH